MFKNKSILTLLAVLLICNTTSPQFKFNTNKAATAAKGIAGLAALASRIAADALPNNEAAQKAAAYIGAGNEMAQGL